MGFRILGMSADLMQGYESRKGLEGPFNFNGVILYYDPKEGKYWNPKTDFKGLIDKMIKWDILEYGKA